MMSPSYGLQQQFASLDISELARSFNLSIHLVWGDVLIRDDWQVVQVFFMRSKMDQFGRRQRYTSME